MSKVQKARVAWLKGLGLKLEVRDNGVVLLCTGELFNWAELRKKAVRRQIEELSERTLESPPHWDDGFHWDRATIAAFRDAAQEAEWDMAPPVSLPVFTAWEDTEAAIAFLSARIEPMIEALEEEVVMEPAAEEEEMAFVITARGVELGKAFRKAIAARAKELFVAADTGIDIARQIQEECLAGWGEITRTRQRGAFAAYRYARAVVRSLENQTKLGIALHINTYWA